MRKTTFLFFAGDPLKKAHPSEIDALSIQEKVKKLQAIGWKSHA